MLLCRLSVLVKESFGRAEGSSGTVEEGRLELSEGRVEVQAGGEQEGLLH